MPNSTDIRIPKVFEHLTNLYHALRQDAVKEDGQRVSIFTGSVVAVYKTIGASMGQYTLLFNILYEMGSIEMLQKGRAGQPSIIALHFPPTLELFEQTYEKALTAPTAAGMLDQRIGNLERRLDGVDVKQGFADFERRLSKLERESEK